MFGRKPQVSVVVVVYNMPREAPRTLYTLSAAYQRDIAAEDYEVIVVDNGSSPPFDSSLIDDLEGNFRVIRLYPAPASPAHAINVGLAVARGDVIGVMIDGARMVTPGLLHFARAGAGLYPRSIVATLGWYLGQDQQRWAIEGHYTRDREDALLDSIDWRANGYQLFDISAPDETTVDGWFSVICESNALFLTRETWRMLGEVDERFDVPGGGFLNLDLMTQALELPAARLVVLLGEGTFHQIHGGVATNASHRDISHAVAGWRAQYATIRGRDWAPPSMPERTYLGVLPRAPLTHFARAVIHPVGNRPLGDTFDFELWTHSPSPPPQDPVVAALLDLAQDELRGRRFESSAVVARIARGVAPDEPGIHKVLAMAAAWLRGAGDPGDFAPIRQANYHMVRGKALAILGRTAEAADAFQAALQCDDDLSEARLRLAMLRMPGEDYLWWLGRLHVHLAPESYLEIGVASGLSLALANPPTRAIGVDPSPHIRNPLRTETTIFCETSDTFFERNRIDALLDDTPLKLAFIDGLHVFHQTLRDFINIERYCAPNSYILLHDTVPFDEITQRADRQRGFYTGDTWRTILCIRHYRPELVIFTIATAPSGLTVITNLNPASRILRDNFDLAVDKFNSISYSEIETELGKRLNIVPNRWDVVAKHLSPAQDAVPDPVVVG